MDDLLKDRIAVVTGAGQGLGEGIATRFAAEGADVVVVDQNTETAERVAGTIQQRGRKALAHRVDVTSWEQVQTMTAEAIQMFGHIDILVNNAGISPKRDGRRIPIHEIDIEQWDQVMAINLKGAFLCAKAIVPHMMARRYGRILNMSSIASKVGWSGPSGAHYAASKAGLTALTRFMAYELAPHNILCNALAPGRIMTPMLAQGDADENEASRLQIPLQRFGTIEEVASLATFLVSDQAAYITGETVAITGGWLIS